MELNKIKLGKKRYVRIVLGKDEYVNSLNCVEEKLLNPLPGDKEIDIGDKLYVVLQSEIAMKLARKLLETEGKIDKEV
ncbi:hypothetical protein ES705_37170 [subsurface metagenome]